MSDSKPRIEFIDLAKGVCIILVVAGHCGIIMPEMFLFLRMPLYFVLSGIFFKEYGGLLNLSVKKINKLIIPFAFFYTTTYLGVWLLNTINPELWPYGGNIFKDYLTFHNLHGAIWFLLCLFWNNIIYFFVHHFLPHKWRFVGVLSLNAIGVALWMNGIKIPLYVSASLGTIFLFWLGSLLKQTKILLPAPSARQNCYKVIIGVMLIVTAYLLHKFFPCNVTWVYEAINGNVWNVYVCSALMVVGVLLILKPIKRLPIISYCGRYSIMILGIHDIFLKATNALYAYYGTTASVSWLRFAIVLILSICCIPLLKRVFPYFTAQKDTFMVGRTPKSN